jgi:phosphotransferase system enzyme I (PtsI)
MEKLKGTSVFEGIIIGKPYIKKRKKLEIRETEIPESNIPKEISRLEEALKGTKREIKHLMDSLAGRVNKNELKILNVQLMMLEDPVFLADINKRISEKRLNAECVVDKVVKKYVGMFKALNDPVYKERATDIQEVGEKIIYNLLFVKPDWHDFDNKILITKEIQPFEILKYHSENIKILGIVTEEGGETSHTAILAKALGIPTLMGVQNATYVQFKENEKVILDSRHGKALLVVSPTKSELTEYLKEEKRFKELSLEIEALKGKQVTTLDGEKILLNINLGGSIEIEQLGEYDPDGVGLLRTEFIYMDRDDFPTEDEQVEIYRRVYDKLDKEKPLIIRTLDIGGDKDLSYFDMPEEENPFLGLRAIRLCLKNLDIFKTQLRAILRAAFDANIQIMFPMISKYEEIIKAKTLLEEVKQELKNENINYRENIEVGMMVEVPSAALLAENFVDEVEFFSIGTNDLTQYMLAADRLSKEVADIYDNYNPAVIRAINIVAEVADKNDKKVSICGEMGGEALGILVFLTMGIKNLSMMPSLLPRAKKIISNVNLQELKKMKPELLKCKTSKQIEELYNKFLLGVV